MNKKTIYSLLVTAIIMGSLIPFQAQAVGDIITWHSSLDDEVIAWRVTEQFLFDPADPPSIAGVDLVLGSTLAFEINDTLPTLFDDVYNSGHPPNFLKLIANYQEVSFYDIDDETEPSFALQFMIIPYLFTPAASGVESNITEFLEYRASIDPNITSVSYAMVGANYVRVSIFNDYIYSFVVTYNNNTGIATDMFIEDDFGEMFVELDIWESSIDDAGVDITNTLHFLPSLVDGTVLSWEFTEITYEPAAMGVMEMNDKELLVGDIIKFEYGVIPTDPLHYYGGEPTGSAPSFFDVFYETEPVRWENITRAQLIIWVTMVNPLGCTLYNGTMITMEYIHQYRDFNDPGIDSTTTSFLGDYMTLEFDLIETEGDPWALSFEVNTASGIVNTFTADIPDFVHFEMEFVPENSSLRNDGTVNPDYPPDDNGTRTLPGFNWFYLLFSTLIAIPIIRRRKK